MNEANEGHKITVRLVLKILAALFGTAAVAAAVADPTVRETESNLVIGLFNLVLTVIVKAANKGIDEAPAYYTRVKWTFILFGIPIVLFVGSIITNTTWGVIFFGGILVVAFVFGFIISKVFAERKTGPTNTQEGAANGLAAIFGISAIFTMSMASIQIGWGSYDYLVMLALELFIHVFVAGAFYVLFRIQGHTGYGGLKWIYAVGCISLALALAQLVIPNYIANWRTQGDLAGQAQKDQADLNRAALANRVIRIPTRVGRYVPGSYVGSAFQNVRMSLSNLVSSRTNSGPVIMSFAQDGEVEPGNYTRFDEQTYQSPNGGDLLIRIVKPNKFNENVGGGEGSTFFVVLKKVVPVNASNSGVGPSDATPEVLADGALSFPARYSGTYEVCAGVDPCTLQVQGQIDFGGKTATCNGSPIMGDNTARVPGVPFGVVVAKVGDGAWFMVACNQTINKEGKTVVIAINDSGYADNKDAYRIIQNQPS